MVRCCLVLAALLVAGGGPARAQGPRAPEEQLLRLVAEGGLDPAIQRLLLLHLLEVRGEEAMFMSLLAGPPAPAVMLDHGAFLIVIDGGLVTKLDAATHETVGQVRYRGQPLAALLPMLLRRLEQGEPAMVEPPLPPMAVEAPAPPPPPTPKAAAPLPEDPNVVLLELLGGQGKEGLELLVPLLLAPTAPIATRIQGEVLLIVDGGTLYRIDLAGMKLLGRRALGANHVDAAAMEELLERSRAQARGAWSLTNTKQLALGVMMFAQDHDETLPGEEWVAELAPYLKNEALFISPAWPNQKLGYALNELVTGLPIAEIQNPGAVVLLFETPDALEAPLGGAALVPDEGPHKGRLAVAFCDGHCELLTPDELRERLEREP